MRVGADSGDGDLTHISLGCKGETIFVLAFFLLYSGAFDRSVFAGFGVNDAGLIGKEAPTCCSARRGGDNRKLVGLGVRGGPQFEVVARLAGGRLAGQ